MMFGLCLKYKYIFIEESIAKTTIVLYHQKIKNLGFLHFPQSQNKNVNNICIVGIPVCMISKQGGVKSWPNLIVCHVDRLFPYHMTGTCERTIDGHSLRYP
jgi:hypothetical protein